MFLASGQWSAYFWSAWVVCTELVKALRVVIWTLSSDLWIESCLYKFLSHCKALQSRPFMWICMPALASPIITCWLLVTGEQAAYFRDDFGFSFGFFFADWSLTNIIQILKPSSSFPKPQNWCNQSAPDLIWRESWWLLGTSCSWGSWTGQSDQTNSVILYTEILRQ